MVYVEITMERFDVRVMVAEDLMDKCEMAETKNVEELVLRLPV